MHTGEECWGLGQEVLITECSEKCRDCSQSKADGICWLAGCKPANKLKQDAAIICLSYWKGGVTIELGRHHEILVWKLRDLQLKGRGWP